MAIKVNLKKFILPIPYRPYFIQNTAAVYAIVLPLISLLQCIFSFSQEREFNVENFGW